MGSASAQISFWDQEEKKEAPAVKGFHLGETLLMYAAANNDTSTITKLCDNPDLDASKDATIKSKYSQEIIAGDAKIRTAIKYQVEKLANLKVMEKEQATTYKLNVRKKSYIKAMMAKDEVSAITVAISYNNPQALNILLKKLKEATVDKDYFVAYLNADNVSGLNFLQFSTYFYYDTEFNPEKNIVVIKLLLAYGANPKANPIQKSFAGQRDPLELDLITLSAINNNAPAIEHLRKYYTSMIQSEDYATMLFLKANAGANSEVTANVYKAKNVAQASSTKETIAALDKWIDMLKGKCIDEGGYVSYTNFFKIYDDDDFLALFHVSYNVELKTSRICDVVVSKPEKTDGSVSKAQMYSEIEHFYSPKSDADYVAATHREVYIMPVWTITDLKEELGFTVIPAGCTRKNSTEVCMGQGVIKIKVGNDPYKAYVSIIESNDDNLRR